MVFGGFGGISSRSAIEVVKIRLTFNMYVHCESLSNRFVGVLSDFNVNVTIEPFTCCDLISSKKFGSFF